MKTPDLTVFEAPRSPMMRGQPISPSTPLWDQGTGCCSPPLEMNYCPEPEKGLTLDDVCPDLTNDAVLFDVDNFGV